MKLNRQTHSLAQDMLDQYSLVKLVNLLLVKWQPFERSIAREIRQGLAQCFH